MNTSFTRAVFPLFALCLLVAPRLCATIQMRDKLLFKGEEYYVSSRPLMDYFSKHPDKRSDLRLRQTNIIVRLTSLSRGYLATYEVKDEQLFVKDIVVPAPGEGERAWESVYKNIFPDNAAPKMDWVAGALVVPHGKYALNPDNIFEIEYENYFVLEFKAGNLVSERDFTRQEYMDYLEKRFEAYKETDAYKARKEELKEMLKRAKKPDDFKEAIKDEERLNEEVNSLLKEGYFTTSFFTEEEK